MRCTLLTLAASAVLGTAAFDQGTSFLGRPMNDWVNDLSDAKPELRRAAAFALGKIGAQADSQKIIDALTHSLSDRDRDVRDYSASGLGDVLTAHSDQAATYWAKAGPALQKALKDADPHVRRSAAYGLGAFGPTAAPARDDLIQALSDESAIVRQNAAYAVGKLGKEAGEEGVAQLRGLLKDGEPLVRRDALHALGEVGNPTAHSAVSAMLKTAGLETDAVVRKAAVEALSHLVGPDDRADAPSLYPLLTDKDPETRLAAAFVLGAIGGREALEALPALREALRSDDSHIQEEAAVALGGLGKDGAPAVEDLGWALTEAKEPDVRQRAALALARIGPPSQKVLPQILQALQPGDGASSAVRLAAAEALLNIHLPGTEPAIPSVLKIVKADPDGVVRQRCLWTLFDVKDLDKYQITPVLIAVLDETGQDSLLLRYDAARVLALRLGDKAPDKVPDVLLDMLRNDKLQQFNKTDARSTGVGAEGTKGNTTVSDDQGGDARYMAAEALLWLHRKAADRPDVIAALKEGAQDKDAKLRAAAANTLDKLGKN
jgi:HEAT repeat protein